MLKGPFACLSPIYPVSTRFPSHGSPGPRINKNVIFRVPRTIHSNTPFYPVRTGFPPHARLVPATQRVQYCPHMLHWSLLPSRYRIPPPHGSPGPCYPVGTGFPVLYSPGPCYPVCTGFPQHGCLGPAAVRCGHTKSIVC